MTDPPILWLNWTYFLYVPMHQVTFVLFLPSVRMAALRVPLHGHPGSPAGSLSPEFHAFSLSAYSLTFKGHNFRYFPEKGYMGGRSFEILQAWKYLRLSHLTNVLAEDKILGCNCFPLETWSCSIVLQFPILLLGSQVLFCVPIS